MIELLSQTTIRAADLLDVSEILPLVYEFYQESLAQYELSFNEETLRETIANFINNHIALLAEKNGEIIGCIGGVVLPSMFDKNQKLGQEAIWYVTKTERKGTTGIRLLRAFEEECIKRGADFISMIYMSNLLPDELRRFYGKMNYKLMENHFIKEV